MVSCYRVMHTGEMRRQTSEWETQIQLEIGISRFLGQAEKYKNQIEVLSNTFFSDDTINLIWR